MYTLLSRQIAVSFSNGIVTVLVVIDSKWYPYDYNCASGDIKPNTQSTNDHRLNIGQPTTIGKPTV